MEDPDARALGAAAVERTETTRAGGAGAPHAARVLALDTAAGTQSAALLEGEDIVAFGGVAGGRGRSDRILALLEQILRLAGACPGDLDVIAVSRGPGSLTGLRVGIGTARGLALGAGARLMGVSTLQSIAAGLGAGPPILALLDAGRGEVYGGLFAPGDPPRPLGEERIAAPERFAEAVAGRAVRIAGSGAARYHGLFAAAPWGSLPGEAFLAAGVGRIAAALLRRERESASAGEIETGGAQASKAGSVQVSEAVAGCAPRAGSSRAGLPDPDPSPRYLRRDPAPVRFET